MALAHAIVGREAELQTLREFLDGPGPPHAVFVEGDAGVGKTAVLEAIVDGAKMPVLRARPTAAEAASSYAALNDLLQPVLDEVGALPAPQQRALSAALLLEEADGPVDPRLVAVATRSLLAARAAAVLITIDDWQWLDAATAAVLSFILRRLEPGGAKVIATVRSGEADEALAALVRALPEGHALQLAVAPLDTPALAALVHTRTGERLSPPSLARLHEACAGNPLMALELIRAPGAGTATDVRRLLGRRIAALPPDCRAFLRVVAALADPTVDAVGGAGLEAALAADVLVRDGRRLRFSHPLIAAVVEERTPPSEWRAIHARLAEEARTAEQRARHLAAAADGPDEQVAAALESAASDAEARGAPIAAAELADQAAALTPDTDAERRVDRLLLAADAAINAGEGPRARPLLEEVLERISAGPRRAHALHKLAYLVDDAGALAMAEAALAAAGDDDELCADIELSAALFAEQGGKPERSRRLVESAAARAEAAGLTFLLSQALSALAFRRHFAGEGVQRELLLRADALERAAPGRSRDDTALQILGLQLTVNGDFVEARELLVGELERARSRGYLDHENFALMLLSVLEIRAGRWQLAESYAHRALELVAGTGLWNDEAAGHCGYARVDAHLGRVESARFHAETGKRQAAELGDFGFATLASEILGFLALSLGDAEEAVGHLAPLPARLAQMNEREPAISTMAPDLAEALVLTGDLEAARNVQTELEARGRELGRAWAIATGLRCRGLIEAAAGGPQRALSTLREALEWHEQVAQPFDRARTLLALGAVQRRAKQRAEARSTLESALAMFEELGAALWAERARAEITRLGGRRARDRDELTQTERQIAELAADGRSNREIAGELFVSERTVEANLTRAYRKLGVRSRTELARRLPAA
jgi:DNA-binding CsgD family transcriptional regulator